MVTAAVVVVLAGTLAVFWAVRHPARPVTTSEAERRLGSPRVSGPLGARPAPGVYRYRGSGTESLSLPPLSQAEGPTLPGTVQLRGRSCWSFRVDYSTNHWQSWDYCLRHGDLEEAGGQTWQRWLIGPAPFTNLSTFHCAPGAMVLPAPRSPGQTWSASCTGTSTGVSGRTTTAGPYRFVGDQTMLVGGKQVLTAHFLRRRKMTGAQQGTERSDVWFAVGTGLPVENRRTIEVRTSTVIGSSTYTETGQFVLISATPVR